jgi:hypothetical protein
MLLQQARCIFTECLADLVIYATQTLGYTVAFDEGMERLTAKDQTSDHMKGSVHHVGLGQDLLLFIDGVYQTKTEAYTLLGEYWERLGDTRGVPLRWGGRFKKADGTPQPDGNHFSFEWQGVK